MRIDIIPVERNQRVKHSAKKVAPTGIETIEFLLTNTAAIFFNVRDNQQLIVKVH